MAVTCLQTWLATSADSPPEVTMAAVLTLAALGKDNASMAEQVAAAGVLPMVASYLRASPTSVTAAQASAAALLSWCRASAANIDRARDAGLVSLIQLALVLHADEKAPKAADDMCLRRDGKRFLQLYEPPVSWPLLASVFSISAVLTFAARRLWLSRP